RINTGGRLSRRPTADSLWIDKWSMDMAIYEEVLAWADRLPPWRQDALRRLCIQGA
ncbi:Orf15, partial [Pseudomonas amygdali pv. mori str. 301020]